LFENLNWLNRNLQLLLSSPPVQKTEEQVETAIIAASQQKDTKPPVKQQQTLSASAPEFTPKASKKKTSLFDEEDDIRKNKVVIVNDPSLIIEQAEEEEVEVELANGDSVDEGVSGQEEEENNEKTLVRLSQPVIRRGTEIRLIDPKLENISLFRCSLLHLMVKCARCKDTVEAENIKPEQEENQASKNHSKTERWMSCPTCSSVLGIKFLGGKSTKYKKSKA
jgi:DNA-directed RNA polymerase subunit RPC12/RpoP